MAGLSGVVDQILQDLLQTISVDENGRESGGISLISVISLPARTRFRSRTSAAMGARASGSFVRGRVPCFKQE